MSVDTSAGMVPEDTSRRVAQGGESTRTEATRDGAKAGAAPKRAIGDALRGHSNSLGVIRLVLAALVIFDHSFVLGGYSDTNPVLQLTNGQATLGSLAVAGFFAISGYLIAKSGLSADIMQFLWRRFLRIFPAYWMALVVGAFAVGPVIWLLNGNAIRDYFTKSLDGPLGYILGNWKLQVHNWGIYDLFVNTPYGATNGSVLNGSIWTLYYEWLCYMIIAVLVVFGVLKRARIVVPFLAVVFLILTIVNTTNPGSAATLVPFFGDVQLIKMGFVFLCGSTIAVYSKSIPYDNWLGFFSLFVVVATLHFGGFEIFGAPAMAYFFLWLGAWLPKRFQRIGATNDYSYGIYIYGFLVQQVLAYFGVYHLGYWAYALSATAISVGLAWLSWHLVEKRAMQLKDWGPGRGLRYWWDRLRARRGPRVPA